jgi:predicted 3-demethylubiquinone-9 3-methyltransferase (glyoxalase superfamily)
MESISPCLWFDNQAEEAAQFYVSVFKNSRIVNITRYFEGAPKPVGSVMTVEFILDGKEFMALNAGPQYPFNPAISLMATCDSQAEVDEYWRKLCEGGQEVQCGWLRDKFGVSWQIVPKGLMEMYTKPDRAAAQRVFSAMVKMIKLDMAVLQRAYDNA